MIYFIEAKDCGLIKIGFTSTKPEERFCTIQVGSPVKLERLAIMKGSLEDESEMHQEFRPIRSHGEWFKDGPEIREFIKNRANPWVKGQTDRFQCDHVKEEFRRGVELLHSVIMAEEPAGPWKPGRSTVRRGRKPGPKKKRGPKPSGWQMLPKDQQTNSFDLTELRARAAKIPG